MKVAVVPVSLEIGGTEVNALELAAATMRLGHDVVVISRPGPMQKVAEGLGLRVRLVDFPLSGRPRPKSVQLLRRSLREERPDIVHAYEERIAVEAFYAVGVVGDTPIVMTEYCMRAHFMTPRSIPVVAGTAEVADAHRSTWGHNDVFVIEPPVDTVANSPDSKSGETQREAWGIERSEKLVVIVSRLDLYFKIDSIIDAIDAVACVAKDGVPARLMVVGDGEAMPALAQRADRINGDAGREIITLAGAMLDPIPAYRAADVVVGMGGSILRAMAIGKPTILVGERGYCRSLRSDTVQPMLKQGFWGIGDGRRGDRRLAALIEGTLGLTESQRGSIGEWGRKLVVERFGLEASGEKLVDVYASVASRDKNRKVALKETMRVPFAVGLDLMTYRVPARLRRAGVMRAGAEGEHYASAQFSLRTHLEGWRGDYPNSRAGGGKIVSCVCTGVVWRRTARERADRRTCGGWGSALTEWAVVGGGGQWSYRESVSSRPGRSSWTRLGLDPGCVVPAHLYAARSLRHTDRVRQQK